MNDHVLVDLRHKASNDLAWAKLKEIAVALGISVETVKWHLKSMFAKLDANSRKHAVTRARTLGVISFGA